MIFISIGAVLIIIISALLFRFFVHPILRRSEQSDSHFKTLLMQSMEAVILQNADGTIKLINDRAAELLDLRIPVEKESYPDIYTDRLLDEKGEKLKREFAPFDRVLKTQDKVRNLITGIQTPGNGHIRWLLVNASPVFSDDRKLSHVIITLLDITELKESEESVRRIRYNLEESQKIAQLGSFEIGQDESILFSNEVTELLSWSEGSIPTDLKGFMQFVSEDDRETTASTIHFALTERKGFELECAVNHCGRVRFIHAIGRPVEDRSGNFIRIMGVLMNITERKAIAEKLELISRVYENSIEGIMITSPDGTIQMVNAAFTNITGYTETETIGKTPKILQSSHHDPEFYRDFWKSLTLNKNWKGEIWNRRKSGEAYPQYLSITAVADEHGKVIHYIAVFHDLTDIKQKEEKINIISYYDVLTRLPNRILFMDRLSVAIRKAERSNSKLCLIFIDLDRFKNVNDSFGHTAGDLLIKKISKVIAKNMRSGDTISRSSGDEFLILLEHIKSPGDAAQIALDLQKNMSQPVTIEGNEIIVTSSLGLAFYPDDGIEPGDLVKNSEAAMYIAKEKGRGGLQFFTPAINNRVVENLKMESQLRKSLEKENFVVYYQPRIDVKSGLIVGAEALVRWINPEGQLINPSQFIPLAEETGLILELGEWVLNTACKQAKHWQDKAYKLSLSVNLSSRQFQQKNLGEIIDKALITSGFSPECLELEITESLAMKDVEKTIATLHSMRQIGIQFSLDDFGTGYSSLYYLKHFPIHWLKIDQSFIRDINQDMNDNAIVTTIISMAKNLKLLVIAEGVETEDQMRFLREQGCDQVQGFLYSPPVSASEFEKTLTLMNTRKVK